MGAPESRESRLRRWARPIGGTLTLLIALWGAFTGSAAWLESRRIDLRMSPGPYPASEREEPIEAALVNRSQRGVALVSGRVLLDGAQVGDVVAVVVRPPLNWRVRQYAATAERARPLPVTLEPSESMTAVLYWSVTSERRRERLVRRMRVKPDPEPPGSIRPRLPVALRLDLELEFDPGGIRKVPVGVVRPRVVEATTTTVQLRHGTVVAVMVGRAGRAGGDLVAPGGVDTIRIWSHRSVRPVRRATRPSGIPGETRFPIRPLPPGRYTWAIRTGDETLAGRLRVPCKPIFSGRRRVPIQDCDAGLLNAPPAPIPEP